MSWFGKLVGGAFGFMLGGPLGAILGASLGHQMDRGMSQIEQADGEAFGAGARERVQTAFFTATFSVMGHVTKADGRVTQQEIALAKQIMRDMGLSAELRKTAQRLFSEGKSAHFPLDAALDQFRKECHRRTNLLRMFIEIQLQAAYADGDLHPQEDRMLHHICQRLGFSGFEYQSLKTIFEARMRFSGGRRGYSRQQREAPPRRSELQDAYGVLGLQPKASDAEVKKAYRRLMSQNHPDKLVAKGLPEEMVKVATEKTQNIRKAYEVIQKSRGN